jgi:tripeptide aminopeptidase
VEGGRDVDRRSTAPSVIERSDRERRLGARAAAAEESARRGGPPLSCRVEVIGDRPCGEVPADDLLVRTALEATRLIGRDPELATASTDANVPIARGIPAIAIGAGGRGGDAHTPAEWYENSEGTLGIARALTIVASAAELV